MSQATESSGPSLLLKLSCGVEQKAFSQCFSVRSENNNLPAPVLAPAFREIQKTWL